MLANHSFVLRAEWSDGSQELVTKFGPKNRDLALKFARRYAKVDNVTKVWVNRELPGSDDAYLVGTFLSDGTETLEPTL